MEFVLSCSIDIICGCSQWKPGDRICTNTVHCTSYFFVLKYYSQSRHCGLVMDLTLDHMSNKVHFNYIFCFSGPTNTVQNIYSNHVITSQAKKENAPPFGLQKHSLGLHFAKYTLYLEFGPRSKIHS